MQVQLLSHTPEPEKLVAAAARLCYSASGIASLLAADTADAARLIRKVLALGHFSVLEHVSFSFAVEDISRACSHQLVRHRLASYSQQSQRYVAFKDELAVVEPPSLRERPELLARYRQTLADVQQLYRDLLSAGIPAEDARFVLPNASPTRLVMTMNARELHHFFSLRCCRRAQWEIRALAIAMLQACREAAPLLFETAGPGCLRGPCPEGAFCCGAAEQVRTELAAPPNPPARS
ncbi:FAD-dependent thymidylate synthase [Desulfuromonas thiophila]|uniref:FAD-dependent thymidylate synthase n=1 Tax=Desulfuromonas thiophila TaxID=57664 RepID=UPI0024A80D35|nr:FAD-dependent thymidylate synthase [Desulfuromonas thiophila]